MQTQLAYRKYTKATTKQTNDEPKGSQAPGYIIFTRKLYNESQRDGT